MYYKTPSVRDWVFEIFSKEREAHLGTTAWCIYTLE